MTFPFEIPDPPYRARQVREWAFRRFARTFGEISELPADLRAQLTERYGDLRPEPIDLRVADGGDTLKAVFPGSYETVAMKYRTSSFRSMSSIGVARNEKVRPDRRTVCVSSQAGCGLGCTFCATGQMGLIRDLGSWEIVAQVLWAGAVLGERPTNVVFMGMGEPLANEGPVMEAVRSIHQDVGISARRITISTVGLVPAIRRLAAEPLPVTLALSLHAPDDETRSSLVPVNRRWPVAECIAAAKEFRAAHGRRVSIEYALIAEVNDRSWQAGLLASLLKGTDIHVNVIPLNPTPGYGVPASTRVEEFARELREGGVNVTVRDTRGRDIDAACGQLAVEAASRL